MKFVSVSIICFFSLLNLLQAQNDTLLVHLKDGKIEKLAISDIQKVRFLNANSVPEQGGKLKTGGNYPNPFTVWTIIEFELALPGDVTVIIYDNDGKQIRELACFGCPAGKNRVLWDCLDEDGRSVPTGSYYYELRFGTETQARKMILLK